MAQFFFKRTVGLFGHMVFVCSTPIHQAVLSDSPAVFKVLLANKDINLDLSNGTSHTALWLALQAETPTGTYDDDSFAGQIVKRGGSTNTVNADTGRFVRLR